MEPFTFVLPSVVYLAAITFVPFVYAIVISLRQFDLLNPMAGHPFVGLENYAEALGSGRFWSSTFTTLIYVTTAVGLETVLGLAIAILFSQEFPGRRVARAMVLIPMMTTPVVIGLTWRMIYDPDAGILNYAASLLGLGSHAWLADPATSLLAVVAVDVWQWTPFMILMMLAGLESLSPDHLEAASIDGASPWQTFWAVMLPQLAPTLAVAVTIRALDAFKTFDLIFIMTNGGPGTVTENLSMYAYKVGFVYFRFGDGTAVAFLFTILVSVLLGVAVNRVLFSGGRNA
ncbi:carbohydrate ABC transporter permease [Limnochorda pilosa]|uniref:Sugar ABC transporter permease n=1 Tax=Limnochorda pilosa TaxID=1555112 RepID=A0A0K2SMG1_LIMPI|nr:sugar ABC transporter permease [Limnochorda pilosa]BAS28182.1 sugar ABC transporter permease [Limnochorda pilosa]